MIDFAASRDDLSKEYVFTPASIAFVHGADWARDYFYERMKEFLTNYMIDPRGVIKELNAIFGKGE